MTKFPELPFNVGTTAAPRKSKKKKTPRTSTARLQCYPLRKPRWHRAQPAPARSPGSQPRIERELRPGYLSIVEASATGRRPWQLFPHLPIPTSASNLPPDRPLIDPSHSFDTKSLLFSF